MEKKPILSFQNFGIQYFTQSEPTLHDINLDIYPGEKILIVGGSGSGKSTLSNCINGLIPHAYKAKTTGSLHMHGNISETSSIFKRSKTVGTLLQDSDAQFVGLSVAEDIAFALENDNKDQQEMHNIVAKVADVVDLHTILKQEPHELSGGQKQRVAMGGVLVDDVEILLFDEPLANLDPASGKRTIALIDDICRTQDKTIIIIEHRIEDVFYRHIDRIILMEEGRIVLDAGMETLLKGKDLISYGLREPLYLTAMKYAGIDLDQISRIDDIEALDLQAEVGKLQHWFATHPATSEVKQQEVMLELRNVDFRYDKRKKILDDVSFSVHKGEMVALVGKNGAGKSTISKIILGFAPIEAGSIWIDGEDLAPLSIKERSQKVGVVLQSPNQMLSKAMIYDEVALGLVYAGLDKAEIDRRVEQALRVCGLLPFRNWPISALSYGQKKRVCVASILVMQPDILILDEPTAGQDYKHYHEIMEFLKELNAAGQTIILITHDMHLMLEYTDRAIVLSDGRIQMDAPVFEVMSDEAVIEAANLKKTSLYYIAQKANIEPKDFIESFIQYEREHGYEG
ncbi:MAG: ABC transporter ATP-binding protein [Erysipelotrichaceae bacterium]